MATLKEVKTKISGVKKTKQITKAMNMVAASRLRSTQRRMSAFRPYAVKYGEVLGSLAGRAGEGASPLLVPREEVKKVHLVICTSDRGLCGGFNNNITEAAGRWLQTLEEGVEVSFTAFGKKGREWVRKNKRDLKDVHLGVVGTVFGFNVASTAGLKLISDFLEGTYDEVHIIYPEFQSMSRQVPAVHQLLPIPAAALMDEEAPEDEKAEEAYIPEHICEPSPAALLNAMLPRNVHIQIFRALLETSTSEHAARMVAMDNATRACNDMIKDLNRIFNKARQAAITNDLMDIVGGAEALRG
ncbi:ATP synthase F1 subcomplex gamma subunit [Desulfobotulus alkaliphilus]|uniref:ATP synthase gamma chain n=1 Tax=Desulfobotulus alkaliphilus TaxID=622671 RepID=A0A562RGJ3_9BACT|nr:ATP synthase F1 subunit gamma [Desulfobotulus alkaliphilus]TWI68222.1 ATP synthase F1 subcomplex gamma subunit [Desulfobotulus alkaliphilus]